MIIKITFLSLLAAIVLLATGHTSNILLIGRAFMMLAVLGPLISVTLNLIADTETWNLRYRR